MNGLVFDIGLGLGLALACGLRPFLPVLLAGALASSKVLGVGFAAGTFGFLRSDWWLLAVAVAFALAYALQMLFGLAPTLDPNGPPAGHTPDRDAHRRSRRANPLAASLAGLGMGAGMLLFAGTLAAHGDSAWPGLIAAIAVVGLAQRVSGPLAARTRARLSDRGAREAVTLYLDSAALVLAALTALLHPLGYVAVALFVWLWLRTRTRTRSGEKYAGLRILGR